jgi:hypothetical protein
VKSRVFIGEDTYDLDSQVRRWRDGRLEIKILKQHPDQQCPLGYRSLRRREVRVRDNAVSRRIDYEVSDN